MEQLQAIKKSEINETEQQHVGWKKPHSKDHLPKSSTLHNEDPLTGVRTGASGGCLLGESASTVAGYMRRLTQGYV